MLYPTELSSGKRTGIEPVACDSRRCSASELSLLCGTPSCGLRHTPRQRRAHQAGTALRREPAPLQFVRRCSVLAPTRANALRLHRVAARAEASRHSACAPRGIPVIGPARPDASGRDAIAL